jgi:hypothetical protein
MDMAPYEWFRESNDSIYMVNVTRPIDTTKDLTEFLLYTFADSIGTTWSLPNGYGATYGSAITISDTSDTITTGAGIFHNCRTFWHTTGARDAGYINSWFARGVGKVKYSEESYGGMRTYSLKSYTVVTDVKSISTAPTIVTYLLMENYPNPFSAEGGSASGGNPSTTIQYYIPEKAYVTVRVIDLLGREVSVLVNEVKHPGTYKVLWDASGWPSGMYFAVLNTNNRSTTTKLVLLK